MSGRVEGRHHCHGPESTERLGEALARTLKGGEFIALRGDLGAGKTCFVRGLARGLGHDANAVSSPTFVLVHEYGGAGTGGPTALVHVDAYRLKGDDDADSIGWDELLSSGAVVAVEWPERIESLLPARRVEVSIDHAGELERVISVTRVEPAGPRAASGKRETCRTCGRELAPTMPESGTAFCSESCRLADLNRWFSGAYRVSRDLKDTDLEEGAP